MRGRNSDILPAIKSSFFAELKRRNVYKVAVAYAVVSWLLLQAASIFLPAFAAPAWAMQAIIVFLLLGFPIALILAWAFEITPEGIKREEEVAPNESMTRRTGRKIVGLTVALAVVAAGLFVFQLLRPRLTNISVESAAPGNAIPEKSIAVLPFENLSSDKENSYFTDGVQDEILTDLAKVADLKVISRTSVMQYRNAATRNLREIGQQLGVAHVLEGSVQRAANKVRVNAQLIDARTDAHLWAENYDRPLDDVFTIQSEIAKNIADQLQAKLSPNEQRAIAQPSTTDLTAHDLFLRARALDDLVSASNGKESLLQAITLLEEAVRRDPKFVRAYCLLVEVHTDLYWGGFDHTPARLELAKAALQKAEHLDPNAGEVHLEKGIYLYHGFREYGAARKELEFARRALPNSSRVYVLIGAVDRREGHWDDAVESFQRAMKTDPRDAYTLEEAGATYLVLRQIAEAKSCLERAFALNPDNVFAGATAAILPYLEKADTRSWRAQLDFFRRQGEAAPIANFYVDCALAERDQPAAEQALSLIPAEGVVDTTNNAAWPRGWYAGLVARSFGEKERAASAFAAAREIILRTTKEQPDYPAGWMILGMIDAGLGRKDDAIAEGKHAGDLVASLKDARDRAVCVNNLALIYAWVGEKDLALEQLSLSAKLPAGVFYGELELGPQWDSLRGDPRFDKIVASLAPKKTAER